MKRGTVHSIEDITIPHKYVLEYEAIEEGKNQVILTEDRKRRR